LLTQALMPLENIANFNDAISLFDYHYTFSYLWLENRIIIYLKNLICDDIIVKCQVKFCLLLDFLHIIVFLTILASTGGPHEISWRATCGPWAAGWTALGYTLKYALVKPWLDD